MYKNNSRNSNNFKSCRAHQPHHKLKYIVSTIGYYSYTKTLMKYWLPDSIRLSKNESRFRIIKEFFSPNTNSKTKNDNIFVADIVEINKST